MRFLCLYKPGQESTGAPTQQEMDAMGALIGEMSQAGVLVQTEGCQPSSKGARVRINGGQFTVVDGPFAEAKELVGGMAVIQVQSKAEAIEWTKRFHRRWTRRKRDPAAPRDAGARIVRLCSGRGIDRRPQRHRRGLAH